MKTFFRLITFMLFTFLVFIIGVNFTQAQRMDSPSVIPISHPANLPWSIQDVHLVDPPELVGIDASLALQPVDDIPYISYLDAHNGKLMLAHFLPNGGGNCGTDNRWKCEILDGDDSTEVGDGLSLDFWAEEGSQTWKIGISYHDMTNRSLKFISWSCGVQLCTLKNSVTIFSDPAATNLAFNTSMKFALDGTPYIAFDYISPGADSLRLAEYIGSGGNCGEGSAAGKWQCTIIDEFEGYTHKPSIDFTYDGKLYIAYYDPGVPGLKLADYWGIIGENCYDDNGWHCIVLDDAGDVGLFPSLVAARFSGDLRYRVAYIDRSNKQLKYVDEHWPPMSVEGMGPFYIDLGVSMDLDRDGYPIIAYGHSGEYISSLKIARPYLAYGDPDHGNCGSTPPGDVYQYWRCSTIVPEEAQYIYPAHDVSLKVNSDGLALIAYSDQREVNSSDLKFVSQNYQNLLPVVVKP